RPDALARYAAQIIDRDWPNTGSPYQACRYCGAHKLRLARRAPHPVWGDTRLVRAGARPRKSAILGAGVIGVTTAHYLARRGHAVTVIDRQSGPALETSFANAGEISPGYSSPWAAPGIPAKAVKWLFMRHAPLILHPQINA